MDSLFKHEEELYEENITRTYEMMEESIAFGVSDMVRGKCMFSSLKDLNECCELLKEAIKKNERC